MRKSVITIAILLLCLGSTGRAFAGAQDTKCLSFLKSQIRARASIKRALPKNTTEITLNVSRAIQATREVNTQIMLAVKNTQMTLNFFRNSKSFELPQELEIEFKKSDFGYFYESGKLSLPVEKVTYSREIQNGSYRGELNKQSLEDGSKIYTLVEGRAAVFHETAHSVFETTLLSRLKESSSTFKSMTDKELEELVDEIALPYNELFADFTAFALTGKETAIFNSLKLPNEALSREQIFRLFSNKVSQQTYLETGPYEILAPTRYWIYKNLLSNQINIDWLRISEIIFEASFLEINRQLKTPSTASNPEVINEELILSLLVQLH